MQPNETILSLIKWERSNKTNIQRFITDKNTTMKTLKLNLELTSAVLIYLLTGRYIITNNIL